MPQQEITCVLIVDKVSSGLIVLRDTKGLMLQQQTFVTHVTTVTKRFHAKTIYRFTKTYTPIQEALFLVLNVEQPSRIRRL